MRRPWVGIGLKDPHVADVLARRPPIDHVELITDNVLADRAKRARMREVRELYPVHLHGLAMNLASTDRLDRGYLRAIRALATELDAFLVSDHLCWTAIGARSTYDLLPFPFTAAMLDHVAGRIHAAQELLGRPLVIENTSTYLRFEQDELSEFGFIAELLRRTGARLLFDVNNLFVTATNHRFDARAALAEVEPDSVAAYHLAGHLKKGGFLLDTHDRPVTDAVWALFAEVVARVGPRPTTLEWDERLPSLPRLLAEAERVRPVLGGARDAA